MNISIVHSLGKIAIVTAVSCTAITGCLSSQHNSAAQDAGVALPQAASTITFYNRIGPLFDSRCAPCHYTGKSVQIVGGLADVTFQGAQAPALTDYASIKRLARTALGAMKSGKMPPANNLGATDVADLQTWINSGMPMGDASTAPQLNMTPQGILDRRCVACHHPSGAVDLTTYDSSSGIHSPVIYLALNGALGIPANMPPSQNLTPGELSVMNTWTSAGGPRDSYDHAPAPVTPETIPAAPAPAVSVPAAGDAGTQPPAAANPAPTPQ